jgi:quercetin dioxygenase-like cupin family protein
MRILLGTVASACLLVAPVAAQDYLDAAKVDSKYHKVEFENDQVRVVRFVVPPGGKTAQHDHPNCVVIALTNYDGRVTAPDGKTAEAHGKAGSATWRNALRHTFENVGKEPAEGLLIEPKSATAASPVAQDYLDAAKVDSTYHKVEFENDQVRVVRFAVAPGGKTAQHDHPNCVVIALTNYDGRVTAPDGKTAEAHGKAGSATWRNALRHTFENVGSQPAEGFLIEPKSAKPVG